MIDRNTKLFILGMLLMSIGGWYSGYVAERGNWWGCAATLLVFCSGLCFGFLMRRITHGLRVLRGDS